MPKVKAGACAKRNTAVAQVTGNRKGDLRLVSRDLPRLTDAENLYQALTFFGTFLCQDKKVQNKRNSAIVCEQVSTGRIKQQTGHFRKSVPKESFVYFFKSV